MTPWRVSKVEWVLKKIHILNLLKCVSCIFNKIFLDMVGEQNSSNAKHALTSKDQVWMFELSDFFTILKVKTFLWPKKSKSLRALIDMLSPSEPISLIMKNIKFLAILRNHIKNNFLTYFICFSEAWLELKRCSLDGCMGHCLEQWWKCIQGVPKKHFQNAAGATVHWLNHHLLAPLVSGDHFLVVS